MILLSEQEDEEAADGNVSLPIRYERRVARARRCWAQRSEPLNGEDSPKGWEIRRRQVDFACCRPGVVGAHHRRLSVSRSQFVGSDFLVFDGIAQTTCQRLVLFPGPLLVDQ